MILGILECLLTLRYLMSYTDAQFAWFSLVFT